MFTLKIKICQKARPVMCLSGKSDMRRTLHENCIMLYYVGRNWISYLGEKYYSSFVLLEIYLIQDARPVRVCVIFGAIYRSQSIYSDLIPVLIGCQ